MHLAAYTASPCFGVPLPGGRPTPSGPMLMSHAEISSGVASCPRFGLSAANATAEAMARPEAAMRRALRVDMLHLALLGNGPGCDGIAVIDGPVAARGDHLLTRRLDVTSFVSGAALQDRRPAVPPPGNAEARQRLRQHRRLQRRRRPALAAVGRNLDFGDP